jgi:hypothetical protein
MKALITKAPSSPRESKASKKFSWCLGVLVIA